MSSIQKTNQIQTSNPNEVSITVSNSITNSSSPSSITVSNSFTNSSSFSVPFSVPSSSSSYIFSSSSLTPHSYLERNYNKSIIYLDTLKVLEERIPIAKKAVLIGKRRLYRAMIYGNKFRIRYAREYLKRQIDGLNGLRESIAFEKEQSKQIKSTRSGRQVHQTQFYTPGGGIPGSTRVKGGLCDCYDHKFNGHDED